MALGKVMLRDLTHLASPFFAEPTAAASDGELPYHALGGDGLERLCFMWLRSQGLLPRFYGRSGDPRGDRSVDLVVEENGRVVVYQCKNLGEYKSTFLTKELQKFETEWLDDPAAPERPQEYRLFAPIDLVRRDDNDSWLALKSPFKSRTGVDVQIIHKQILDVDLKHMPDVVADLFGLGIMRRFCDVEDWAEDLFVPVTPSASERRAIAPFYALKSRDAVARDLSLTSFIDGALQENGVVLLHGPPGSGKSMAALDTATSFQDGVWRVYYVSLLYGIEQAELERGILRRSSRDTIFVIDDCHDDPDRVARCLDRLERNPAVAAINLIFVMRSVGFGEGGGRSNELLQLCESRNAAIGCLTSPAQFRRIIAKRHRNWPHIRNRDLESLYGVTGGDLNVLHLALGRASTLQELVELDRDHLYRSICHQYFAADSVHAPDLMRFAALAQFEISWPREQVHQELVPVEYGEGWKALVYTAGRPAAYRFVHSSSAEVVFRSLCWAAAREDVDGFLAEIIVEHFTGQQSAQAPWSVDFLRFISNRLRLSENGGIVVKRKVLAHLSIQGILDAARDELPLNLLSLTAAPMFQVGSPYQAEYATRLFRQLDQMVRAGSQDGRRWAIFALCLRTLRLSAPGLADRVEAHAEPAIILEHIANGASIPEFLRLASQISTPLLTQILDGLDADAMDCMVGHTINGARSISAMGLAMRSLATREPAPQVLRAVELKIGVERVVRLVAQIGDFVDLARVMVSMTSDFRVEFLSKLDDEVMNAIFLRTLARKNASIGTLNLSFRELGRAGPSVLKDFEKVCGVGRLVRVLIAREGSLATLFRWLSYLSPDAAAELIESLSSDDVAILSDRVTVEGGPSLSYINRSIRRLKWAAPTAWPKLFSLIPPAVWWNWAARTSDLRLWAYVLIELSNPERSTIAEAAEARDRDCWHALVVRSGLYEVADFCVKCVTAFDRDIQDIVLDEVGQNIASVVYSSGWFSLNTALSKLKELSVSEFRTILAKACQEKADRTDLVKEDFESAFDTLNALRFVQKLCPDKVRALGEGIAEICPPTASFESWCRPQDSPLTLYRVLMGLCRSPSVSAIYARQVLDDGALFFPKLVTEDPYAVMLFLWAYYALWFERRPEGETMIRERLSPEIISRIVSEIADKADKRMSNERKLGYLGLVGVIDKVAPERYAMLSAAVRGRMKGASYLLLETKEWAPIPRFFMLRGLTFILPRKVVFTSERCDSLLVEIKEYDEVGPALRALEVDIGTWRTS